MPLHPDNRLLLRDLALLLGLPTLAFAGLLVWWQPWQYLPGGPQEHWETHPASEAVWDARHDLETRARVAGIHKTSWHGLALEFPSRYAFILGEPTLELLERELPEDTDNDHWPAQMAFADLDSAAISRFRQAGDNCALSQGRCWKTTAGRHRMHCQRSAGVPDPAITWTPHLECQLPQIRIRVLVNAPVPVEAELLGLFKEAVANSPATVRD